MYVCPCMYVCMRVCKYVKYVSLLNITYCYFTICVSLSLSRERERKRESYMSYMLYECQHTVLLESCVSSRCVFHHAVCFIALCVSSRSVFHRSSRCVFHRTVCFHRVDSSRVFHRMCVSSCSVFHRAVCFIVPLHIAHQRIHA